MTSVEVEAGAFLDLGNKVSRMHDHMMRGKPRPVYKVIGGNAPAAVGVTVPVTVETQQGDVPPGRIHNLLWYGMWATDGHTALANAVADIYIAGSGVQLPDFSCQIDFGRAIPFVTALSEDIHWIQPGERLVAIVYGFTPAAGLSLTLMSRVADYPSSVETMSL